MLSILCNVFVILGYLKLGARRLVLRQIVRAKSFVSKAETDKKFTLSPHWPIVGFHLVEELQFISYIVLFIQSCPLVTPYYCRLGDLFCFVFIV